MHAVPDGAAALVHLSGPARSESTHRTDRVRSPTGHERLDVPSSLL